MSSTLLRALVNRHFHQKGAFKMSDLYKRIEDLCKQRGTNITEMCKASGAARGSLTDLKMGRTSRLNTTTLSRISEHFGVTVDYLLGMDETKKTPTPEGEREELKEKVFRALEAADPAIREAALRLLGVQE
jgi:transcriptional regulator with XRE-family HTH domain